MILIAVGSELDQAVAEASGIELMSREDVERRWALRFGNEAVEAPQGPWIFRGHMSRTDQQMRRFQPSSDLNDTFLAADKFGLFKGRGREPQLGTYCGIGKRAHAPIWAIANFDDWDRIYGIDPIATGETPALAICAAILKLAEAAK